MKRISLKYILAVVGCLWSFNINTQDLSNLDKKTLFDIHGNLRTNHVFYSSRGKQYNRDPYQYIFSANLNLKFLLWEMPLSFTYTNKRGRFQHSLNHMNFRPSYKWLTLYIGKSNMNFSSYTLSGRLFEGLGVEIKPEGKIEGSAFYGRLQKAVKPDTSLSPIREPAYKRMAFGVKTAYKPADGEITCIVFHSADDPASLSGISDVNTYGEKNLSTSIKATQKFFDKIQIRTEVANSQITYLLPGHVHTISSEVLPLKESNYAVNAGAEYLTEKYTVGLGYERVDPEYRTHGAYYFNNDLENITLTFSTKFLNNKIGINTNTGFQRDNLDQNKMSKMNRFVGSGTINFIPNEKWNTTISYSNFRSHTRMWKTYEEYQLTQPYQDLDTFNYIQISQNLNSQINITLGNNDNYRHQLNANGNYQVSDNVQGNEKNNNTFLNANIMYAFSYNPLNITVSPGFSGYGSAMANINSLTAGPVISISKSFKPKNIRSSMSFNHSNTYIHKAKTNSIFIFRMMNRFTYKKKHKFSLIITHLKKNQVEPELGIAEFSVTFNYIYQFLKL